MSSDAVENDGRQTSKVSRYQLITQPKLDKFQLQFYSRCSKWRPVVPVQQCRRLHHWSTLNSVIRCAHCHWNSCLCESVVGYQAIRFWCPSS